MHPRVHIAIRALRDFIIFRIHVNIFFQELNYYNQRYHQTRRSGYIYCTPHSQSIESIKIILFFQKKKFNDFVFNIPNFQQLRISVKYYLIL
jgi:hypothetical protein